MLHPLRSRKNLATVWERDLIAKAKEIGFEECCYIYGIYPYWEFLQYVETKARFAAFVDRYRNMDPQDSDEYFKTETGLASFKARAIIVGMIAGHLIATHPKEAEGFLEITHNFQDDMLQKRTFYEWLNEADGDYGNEEDPEHVKVTLAMGCNDTPIDNPVLTK